jgi:light-regulated signal transduction histidine kinase (bacteriophytochrome)
VLSLSYYALLLALGFSILIAHTAVILYRTDMDRERAESHVRMLNARLEARVTERTQELEAANKELEAFSYSVSHDLRAPLRAIDGFGRVLAEDYASQLDEEGHRHLSRIQLAARRMGELIDGLLVLARVTRNDMHRERVDLSDIAADLVASMRRDSGAREVRVDIESGLVVHGDSRLLRVALENLLGNAWKFTRGTREPHITFGRLPDDGETTYFVRDNGAGFDMNYAQRLFGAFERLHREAEFEGTGVGLATVRRIVQRHGGRIWAKSAVGQGATFLFTLPGAAAGMTPPDAPAD